MLSQNSTQKICISLFLHIGCPLLTIIPPAVVAYFVSDLEFLVGITGSYAGAGIQYITPCMLVICARRHLRDTLGVNYPARNKHRSPFHKKIYIWLTLIWCFVCMIFVTVNHFDDYEFAPNIANHATTIKLTLPDYDILRM